MNMVHSNKHTWKEVTVTSQEMHGISPDEQTDHGPTYRLVNEQTDWGDVAELPLEWQQEKWRVVTEGNEAPARCPSTH